MNPFWIGVFAAGIGFATVVLVFLIITIIEAFAFVKGKLWGPKTKLVLRGILLLGLGLIMTGSFMAALHWDKWRDIPWR